MMSKVPNTILRAAPRISSHLPRIPKSYFSRSILRTNAPAFSQNLPRIPKASFANQIPTVTTTETAPLAINTYMKNIYLTSLATFGSILGASWLLSSSAFALGSASILGGFALSLGGVIGFSFHKPPYVNAFDVSGQQKIIAVNTFTRKLWYGAFATGSVLMLAPLFTLANAISPTIAPLATLLTVGTFLGSSAYALNQPLGKFSSWGSVLTGTLVSLILLQLGGLGAAWAMGPNAFSNIVWSVQPYIGVGLFTAFQMFDTQAAVMEYEAGNVDVLGHSMNYVLNLKNLFVSFLQILMRFFDSN